MLKNILRLALKRFGIVAFKRSSQVYIPEDESYRIVSALAGRSDPVVIDGGAHLGDMAERFGALLPSSESLQPDLKQLCELVEQVEVEVITIDEYCRAKSVNHVDVIKLDLQGYDYRALKGAVSALEKARVVFVEVLFEEIYQGCRRFPDTLNLMIAQWFKLHTLCVLHYGEADELLWADAIFVKSVHLAIQKPEGSVSPST